MSSSSTTPNAAPIDIYLVDSSDTSLATVHACIAQRPGWRFAGHSTTVRDAISRAANTNADVYLVGLDFPDGAGHHVLEHLKHSAPDSRRLVFTTSLDSTTWLLSFAHGATGFALKDTSPDELGQCIEQVHPEMKPRYLPRP